METSCRLFIFLLLVILGIGLCWTKDCPPCSCKGESMKCRNTNLLSMMKRNEYIGYMNKRVVRIDARTCHVYDLNQILYFVKKTFPNAIFMDITLTNVECQSGQYGRVWIYTSCVADSTTPSSKLHLSTTTSTWSSWQRTTVDRLTIRKTYEGEEIQRSRIQTHVSQRNKSEQLNMTLIVVALQEEAENKRKHTMMLVYILAPLCGFLFLVFFSLGMDKLRRSRASSRRGMLQIQNRYRRAKWEEEDPLPGLDDDQVAIVTGLSR